MKTLLTCALLFFLNGQLKAQNITSKKTYSSVVPVMTKEKFITPTGQKYLVWKEGNKRFINMTEPRTGKMIKIYL